MIFTKRNILQFLASIATVFIVMLVFMIWLCAMNNDTSIPTIIMAIKISGLLTGFVACVGVIRAWMYSQGV